ncbi:MAG: hypothetical protein U0531_11210 [Dehalococcoidia bacterium]
MIRARNVPPRQRTVLLNGARTAPIRVSPQVPLGDSLPAIRPPPTPVLADAAIHNLPGITGGKAFVRAADEGFYVVVLLGA